MQFAITQTANGIVLWFNEEDQNWYPHKHMATRYESTIAAHMAATFHVTGGYNVRAV